MRYDICEVPRFKDMEKFLYNWQNKLEQKRTFARVYYFKDLRDNNVMRTSTIFLYFCI